ncbi:MAG TPA: choice-of-anchor tandem repeat GloVer-containing protein [Candidatus Cybelea sp.]|nr:choice-of-anchor tandem repeat GloVer-containing protein [Candidatus Cybelea sp.]
MNYLRKMAGAGVSAALLSACGGSGFSSSTPMPVAAQLRATGPAYKSLYSFKGPDGNEPQAGLIAVSGALYGTTTYGGAHGWGTVFKITTAGAESVIYAFKGKPDGGDPDGSLILVNGQLYGTTNEGGKANDGSVFTVNPSTGKERVLFSFKGEDGLKPEGALVAINGTLYGTTTEGGRYRYGTVFAVSASGTERVLHSFKDYMDGGDGAVPEAGLTEVNGALYGMTEYGGTGNSGSIFEVSTSGTEKVIYSFEDGYDGANPSDSLTDLDGTLYGTAEGGYAGSVFKVSTSGALSVLYDFKGAPDGALPEAGVLALNGTTYGTTIHGGSSSYYCLATAGCGTVFAISASGTETVLYRFKGIRDGAFPVANLTALKGVLYGTTSAGGEKRIGTVFEVTP